VLTTREIGNRDSNHNEATRSRQGEAAETRIQAQVRQIPRSVGQVCALGT